MVKKERIKEEKVKEITNYAVRVSNDGTVFCRGIPCPPKCYADWMVRCEHCFIHVLMKKVIEYK